jgi:tetratricopeptide (TPR) repeat protein
MKVFVSYASEDLEAADAIAVALRNSGHQVFLDRDSLPAAKEYHEKIRDQIKQSDLFVFLISPASLAEGRYTLTELKFARQRWPKPQGRIVPVMIRDTPMSSIPAYLSSLNIIKPEGNVVAEVISTIQEQRKSERFGRTAVYAALGVAVLGLGVGGVFGVGWLSQQAALQAQADACAIANELIQLKSPDQLSEAAMRQSAMCRELALLKQGDPRERRVADLMGEGEVDQALDLLEEMAKEKPETAERWDRIATLAYWRDSDRAFRARQAVERLDPSNIPNRFGLADLYGLQGQQEAALGQLEKVLSVEDKFARLLALESLCIHGQALIASHPEWGCDKLQLSDLIEAYKTTTLDRNFAAEQASNSLSGRMFVLVERTKAATSTGDVMAATNETSSLVDAVSFFSDELLKTTSNEGLAELTRIQLEGYRTLNSMLSGVQQAASTLDLKPTIPLLTDSIAKLEALEVRANKLSSRFSSPLVSIERGNIASNIAIFTMVKLKFEAEGGVVDPAKVDPILDALRKFSDEFEEAHQSNPRLGIAGLVMFFIYTWEDLAEQYDMPRVGAELARLEFAWATRLAEAEKNSTGSQMALLEAHYQGWKQFEGDEKAAAGVKARALLADLRRLADAQQWSGRLDFMEQALDRGGEIGSMSILDLIQSDPSFIIPSTPDEPSVRPAPATPQ